MPCRLARARLFEYVDGELPEEQRALLERHVAECADCRQLVEVERSFAEQYVARLRPDPVPDEVHARVGGLLRAHPRGSRGRWTRRLGLGGAVFAAGILAGIGLGAGLDAPGMRLWPAGEPALVGLAAASVEQHQKLARGTLPLDIAGVTPRGAEEWFKARLDFNVNLPEVTRDDLTLVGGRIAHLRDLEVAALRFTVDGRDVSLFVIPFEKYRSLGIGPTPKFKMVTQQGYDVIVWASHGMAYSLVSEIGGRSCLVCHSGQDRIELPRGSRAHDRL
jgi:anti-sigma factor RsiW